MSATLPTIMCPRTSGSFGSVSSPSKMCKSVLQTAQADTSIRTWSAAGSGSGRSCSTRGCLGFSRTIARIPAPASVRVDDLVERRPLGRCPACAAGGVDQLLWLEPDAVLRAGHSGDVLLHQRPAEVVDTPAQALGRRVETHLHPACLEIRDRLSECESKGGGVLEVVEAGDLLHPVGSPEQRVERDEAERHELGDPTGSLLQAANDPHVTGQLPRLLDVAEH